MRILAIDGSRPGVILSPPAMSPASNPSIAGIRRIGYGWLLFEHGWSGLDSATTVCGQLQPWNGRWKLLHDCPARPLQPAGKAAAEVPGQGLRFPASSVSYPTCALY
ncbi:hypothetical protein GQ55_2G333000 [Panicum hallii var. hallii]|uniref:Uncharacterized protein n=1 Tax=Panicum hallii var. hallii TaxID=1504633 RepID=A0A2T7EV34_9POAL|nr:hypothetical protein GQ55_2G333000 [Panicum hallii var. hallii]